MKLSIIIVSYNTQKLILNCLKSVYKNLPKDSEVIVVDNASVDHSIKEIKKSFPQVKIISNKQNQGFAAANNQGLKKAKGDFLFLLNPDTLVSRGSLNTLIDFAKKSPHDIISPKLLNPDQTTQSNGGSLPNFLNLFTWAVFLDKIDFLGLLPKYHQSPAFFNKTRSVGWVSGAALLIKGRVYEKLSGLDELIFMYSEDTEYCWRAKDNGFKIATFAGSTITHLAHGSGSKRNAIVGEFEGLEYLFAKYKNKNQQKNLRRILKLSATLRVFVFAKILRNEEKAQIYRDLLAVAR